MGNTIGGAGGTGGGGLGGLGLDLAPYKMPVIGGFFQNPDELHQKQQSHEMAMQYGAMRPETQQSQENALKQTSLTYQPYQNLMAMGYGDSAATPTDGLMENPMSERQMELGNPRGMNGEPPAVAPSPEAALGAPLGQGSTGGGGATFPGGGSGDGVLGGVGGSLGSGAGGGILPIGDGFFGGMPGVQQENDGGPQGGGGLGNMGGMGGIGSWLGLGR